MFGPHRIVLAHAAGQVDAEHLELIAEIRRAHPTRAARAAAHDWLDHDPVAGGEPAVLRRLDDLGERLVADDAAARNAVVEMALEDVEIGAADADPAHPQKRLAAGRRGYGDAARREPSGPLVEGRTHGLGRHVARVARAGRWHRVRSMCGRAKTTFAGVRTVNLDRIRAVI